MPATGLNLSSTWTQCSFATLPSSPENFCVSTANSRLRAFGLARRGPHLQRPVRPGQALVLVLGRRRHDFELRHGFRALPERGADAVRAGVAAADHDDMLAAGEDVRPRRRAARRRRGGSAAAGNPSRSGCRRDRGRGSAGRAAASAPPVSATASYWLSSSRGSIAPGRARRRHGRRNGTSRPRLPSAPRGGR